ncbi:hypothetical protein YC2023_014892 [Brassica napus]
MANINDGRLHLTNDTKTSSGHTMLKTPLNLTATSPSSFSFSTEFVFVIFPLAKPPAYGQGMAFVVASKTDLMAKGTATSGLGLFNPGNKNITENQILAVELDISESSEQFDESDNHVGIDINKQGSEVPQRRHEVAPKHLSERPSWSDPVKSLAIFTP